MWLDPHTRFSTPAHGRWLENEFDALIDFASGSATPHGFGHMDSSGTPIPGKGHALFITCRMVHTYALAHLMGRPGASDLIDHGIASLTSSFKDQVHGGWYSSLDDDGEPDDTTKAAYAHAFVILAAASARVAGRPHAHELLTEALDVSLEKFWDEDAGMVVESWDRSFATLEEYRGINAKMHTVEAYLSAADATGDDAWVDRALRITGRALDDFARNNSWRLPEHFTREWQPMYEYNLDDPAHPFRPAGATVGHWFEWARLALWLEATLIARGRPAPAFLADVAEELFRAGVHQGWAVDGEDGFVYTVDFSGRPLVRERMHWVVAEALGAAAVLYRRTGEQAYERWYRRWWQYATDHLIGPAGSWCHELSPTNGVSATVWEGRPDIYHAAQATLFPRLPLTPGLAAALDQGFLKRG